MSSVEKGLINEVLHGDTQKGKEMVTELVLLPRLEGFLPQATQYTVNKILGMFILENPEHFMRIVLDADYCKSQVIKALTMLRNDIQNAIDRLSGEKKKTFASVANEASPSPVNMSPGNKKASCAMKPQASKATPSKTRDITPMGGEENELDDSNSFTSKPCNFYVSCKTFKCPFIHDQRRKLLCGDCLKMESFCGNKNAFNANSRFIHDIQGLCGWREKCSNCDCTRNHDW